MTRVRFELLPPRNNPDLPRFKRRRYGHHWRALAVHAGKRTHLACASSPVRPQEVGPFKTKAEAKLIKLGLDRPTIDFLLDQVERGLNERLARDAADGGSPQREEMTRRAKLLARTIRSRPSTQGARP